MGKFIEKLIEKKFNLNEEILTIRNLLNEEFTHKDYYNGTTYLNIINSYFKNWSNRKTFVDIESFTKNMGIDLIYKKSVNNYIGLDDFIYYAEYVLNIIFIPYFYYDELKQDFRQNTYSIEYDISRIKINFNTIMNNIIIILESLNYEYKFFEGDKLFKVVEKDFMVAESAEVIQDEYNLGEKIYLYGHRDLKGKLFDKADILARLYKWFEGHRDGLKKSYSDLESNIGELSNSLDVRHAPKGKQIELLKNITEEEQEEWYDKLFKLYLSAIILNDYLSVKPDIKELKEKLNK